MNKGDSIRLVLDYSVNGKEIKKDQFEDLELQLNKESFGKYHVKLLLSRGEMAWDEDLQKYVAYLPQEESFKLPNKVEYQLRCYNDGSVISSNIGFFFMGDILSKEMLPYE